MHAYLKRRYQLGATSDWELVTCPIATDYVALRNRGEGPILLRSDPSDPTSEDVLPAGGQEGITVPFRWSGEAKTRFQPGESLIWAKSGDNLAQLLVVTWVR